MALHPMASESKKQPSLVEEHFEPVMDDGDQNMGDADASSESSEDESGDDKRRLKNKSQVPR